MSSRGIACPHDTTLQYYGLSSGDPRERRLVHACLHCNKKTNPSGNKDIILDLYRFIFVCVNVQWVRPPLLPLPFLYDFQWFACFPIKDSVDHVVFITITFVA